MHRLQTNTFSLSFLLLFLLFVLSRIVELTAADRAMDEALFHINKAFTSGTISLEVFLKYTRLVAREQFYKRAAMKKVFQDHIKALRAMMPSSPAPTR